MMFMAPIDTSAARATPLEKTENITTLPVFDSFPADVVVPVLLKTGADISTDDIIPAGTRVMPYWSNISKVSAFTFERNRPHLRLACSAHPRPRRPRRPCHRGRHQLRPRLQPRKCRHRTALSRRSSRHREKLRAHPLAKSHQLRSAAPELLGSIRLRPATCRRHHSDPGHCIDADGR